jgi:hypothetical protein
MSARDFRPRAGTSDRKQSVCIETGIITSTNHGKRRHPTPYEGAAR